MANRSLKKIETDLKLKVSEIEDLIEEFSQLRFELIDRVEKSGDPKAMELYEGWTRLMHLHLGNAMEQKPD